MVRSDIVTKLPIDAAQKLVLLFNIQMGYGLQTFSDAIRREDILDYMYSRPTAEYDARYQYESLRMAYGMTHREAVIRAHELTDEGREDSERQKLE